MAPLVYGTQLQKISGLEKKLAQDPAEKEVAAIFLKRAREYEARLQDIEGALQRERSQAQERVRKLKQQDADSALIVQASRELAALPKGCGTARERWVKAMAESYERAKPLGGMPPHSQPFAGDPDGSAQEQRSSATPDAISWP
jgi:cation/acetate symporter